MAAPTRRRLHRSSCCVALATAAVMAVIVLPGEAGDMDLWPEFETIPCGLQTLPTSSFDPTERLGHGWPATFLKRKVRYWPPSGDGEHPWSGDYPSKPLGGVPWLSANAWKPWQSTEPLEFSATALAWDAIVAMAVIAVATAAWELRRRRRQRLLQFTLLDLLTITTMVAAVLGWCSYQRDVSRRERIVEQRIEELAGEESWDAVLLFFHERCMAPRWLQRLAGRDALPRWMWGLTDASSDFATVGLARPDFGPRNAASRANSRGDRDFSPDKIRASSLAFRLAVDQLESLPRLCCLEIVTYGVERPPLMPDDARYLGKLAGLRELVIWYPDEISPAAREVLAEVLPQCEIRCHCDTFDL